jgi:hypothetical protein
MNQKSIKMKSVNQPAELPVARDHDFVDQFLQESDYLPVQGDQSWREQAALHIAAGYDEGDETETPSTIPTRADRLAESNFDGGTNWRALLVAFFAVAILIPAALIFTAPDILTADFWRANRGAANPASEPAPPVRTATVPAPVIAKQPPQGPSKFIAQDSKNPPTAKATPPQTPPLRPADSARDLKAETAANAPPERAAPPKQQPAERTANRDGGTGGFGSFVLGPDGRLQYRYFPTATSSQPAQPSKAESDDPGFYAMVPDPDGTLRYKHFPSKPAH